MNFVKITTSFLFLVLALSFSVFAGLPVDVQKGEFDGKYTPKDSINKYLTLEEQAGNLDLVKTGYYENQELQKYSAIYQRRYASPQTSVMAIKATNTDLAKKTFYNEFVLDRGYVAMAIKDFLVSPDSKRLFQSKENQIIYTRKDTKLNQEGTDNTFAWISNDIIYVVNSEKNKLNLDSAEVYLHLFLGLHPSGGVVEKPVEKELEVDEKNDKKEEIEVEKESDKEVKFVENKELEEKKSSIIKVGDNFKVNLQDGLHEFQYSSYNYSSRVFVLLDKRTSKEFELVFAPSDGCRIRSHEVWFEVSEDKILIKGEEKCGENKVYITGVDVVYTKKSENNKTEKQKEAVVVSSQSPKETLEKDNVQTKVNEEDSSTKLLLVAIKLEETKIGLEIISKKLEGIADYYLSAGEERNAKVFSDASKEIFELTKQISSLKIELKDSTINAEKRQVSLKEKITSINLNFKEAVKKLLEAI